MARTNFLPLFGSSSFAPAIAIAGVVVCYHFRRILTSITCRALSRVIHLFLCWRYPIKGLPTAPYAWPNGHGDAAKFLNGARNSIEWGDLYGNVYRIWSGMNPEVVVTRSEHVREIFRDSDCHIKAENNDSGYLLSQLLGQCVGLISGDLWRAVRTRVEVPFRHRAAVEYLPRILEQTENYFRDWERTAEGSADASALLLDPAADLKMYPFLLTARLVYGGLDETQVARLRELAPLREHLFTYVIAGGVARYAWSKYLPTKANELLTKFLADWLKFNKEAYERAKVLQSGAPIVAMWEAAEAGVLEKTHLLQTLDEQLFANLDVTTGAIAWNLVHLATHDSEQQQLLKEIRENLGGEKRREDYFLRSDTFLAACINESSRLRPVAAFSIPQSAPSDKIVGGYTIPKRTNIIVDSYALNIRNEYWGPDSTIYRPSRFLKLKPSDYRYQMWRFGFGPRQCMGKYLADMMLRACVAYLVENYQLSPTKSEGDNEVEVNPDCWITHPQTKIRCVRR